MPPQKHRQYRILPVENLLLKVLSALQHVLFKSILNLKLNPYNPFIFYFAAIKEIHYFIVADRESPFKYKTLFYKLVF